MIFYAGLKNNILLGKAKSKMKIPIIYGVQLTFFIKKMDCV